MTGWWLVSYAVLWLIILLVVALQLGTLRELALVRHGGHGRALWGAVGGHDRSNGPESGSHMPEIGVETANGYGSIPLSPAERRTSTLIAFMSPTCEGCQILTEPLNALANTHGEHLVIRVILSGPDTACRSFLKLFPLEMPVVIDPAQKLAKTFDVHRNPTELLYDENGLLTRKGTASDYEDLIALVGGAVPSRNDVPAAAPM